MFTRRVKQEASRGGEGTVIEGGAGGHQQLNREGIEDGTAFSVDMVYSPEIETTGPERQIIHRMPTKWERRFRNLIKWNKEIENKIWDWLEKVWDKRPWREKTAIELEYEAEVKRRDKLNRTLMREGNIFADRATNAYARMGLCYVPARSNRSMFNPVQKVRFTHIIAEPNAVYMKIDTMRLPIGVSVLDLVYNEGILTNVSASLRHHVTGMYDVEKGAWLCVERGRGVRGIPRIVSYQKMRELRPVKADRMTIPLGETINSKRIYRSLRDFPHLLVGGSTGQGKTTYLNVVLASLIENNTPNQLRIVLVDLKGGIEFSMYKGIPHLWKMGGKKGSTIAPEGIVGRLEKVNELLHRVKAEGERRLRVFQEKEVTNIDEYNRKFRRIAMDRIVVVFDEWARIALQPEGKEAERLLSDICATYRAVGFHVILATQNPKAEVINTLITTNFNARLAFGVPNMSASMVMLGSGKAVGLSPVGRSIFQMGAHPVETQVPLIDRAELTRIIDEAKEDGGEVEEVVTTLEILQYSLHNLGGSLAGERIFQHFRDRIGHNAILAKLKSMDNMLVDIDGIEYIIDPPDGGNKPREIKPYIKEASVPPVA